MTDAPPPFEPSVPAASGPAVAPAVAAASSLASVLPPVIRAGAIMFGAGGEIVTVRRVINSLLVGARPQHLHIFVAHNALTITVVRGQETLTMVQSIDGHGVDFNKIGAIYRLAKKAQHDGRAPANLAERVNAVRFATAVYPRQVSALAVALACGAFAVIFGGGAAAFVATALAAFLGAHTRFFLASLRFNVVLVFAASAFVATSAALALGTLVPDHHQIVETACVLYLIPGVPLIDAFEEFIRGYVTVGLTRAVMGLVMVMALALGMVLALSLRGIW
ncbi:MAG: threonine/serine exporter family protein [Solidesulfovibrio sp. DCME]|uniref:threonine/serine exporter family protein n=1 Tax=Solidesulfovibrio sp. DCME TaxID=3447380 RepID=UPI003D0F512C